MILKLFLRCLIFSALLSMGSLFCFAEQLPANLKWLTNDTAPIIASPHAKKGGTYRTYMTSFPLTLRTVGPDSNGGFASYLRSNQMSLIELHNNTEEIIPGLATDWAYGEDKKTMYFKLDNFDIV